MALKFSEDKALILWCEKCRTERRRWILPNTCPHWPWDRGSVTETLEALVERLR